MNLNRSIEIQRATIARIRDAYSAARCYHSTSEALNARILAIYADLPRGTPNHVREYVRGYAQALGDGLYDSLVFGGIVDGVFYSTHRNRPDYYEAHGIEPRDYADDGRVTRRGHYWADDTSKPFFVSAGYGVTVDGVRSTFTSYVEAKAFAESIFAKSGAVVGIENVESR